MKIVMSPENTVAANDRGLMYGDGCFSTIRALDGKPQLWALHLQRLKRDCVSLFIDGVDFESIECEVKNLASKNTHGVVKVMITRGTGGRGYAPPLESSPVCIISFHEYPNHYVEWHNRGVNLGVSSVQLGTQPALAGVKHLNRLEQVLIKKLALSLPFDDVLVTDCNNKLIEASAANVFWKKGNRWFTPLLSGSGVSGVMRQALIQALTSKGKEIDEVLVDVETLLNADSVYLTNALMGIMPVKQITFSEENQTRYSIRPVSEEIMKELNV